MTSSGAVLQNQSSAAELKSAAMAGGQKSAQGLAPPRTAGRPSVARGRARARSRGRGTSVARGRGRAT